MQSILPLLLVLVCPVMMVLMMRGMHGAQKHHAARVSQQGMHHTEYESELRALREQNDDLEARVEELEYRLEQHGESSRRQLTTSA